MTIKIVPSLPRCAWTLQEPDYHVATGSNATSTTGSGNPETSASRRSSVDSSSSSTSSSESGGIPVIIMTDAQGKNWSLVDPTCYAEEAPRTAIDWGW